MEYGGVCRRAGVVCLTISNGEVDHLYQKATGEEKRGSSLRQPEGRGDGSRGALGKTTVYYTDRVPCFGGIRGKAFQGIKEGGQIASDHHLEYRVGFTWKKRGTERMSSKRELPKKFWAPFQKDPLREREHWSGSRVGSKRGGGNLSIYRRVPPYWMGRTRQH